MWFEKGTLLVDEHFVKFSSNGCVDAQFLADLGTGVVEVTWPFCVPELKLRRAQLPRVANRRINQSLVSLAIRGLPCALDQLACLGLRQKHFHMSNNTNADASRGVGRKLVESSKASRWLDGFESSS